MSKGSERRGRELGLGEKRESWGSGVSKGSGRRERELGPGEKRESWNSERGERELGLGSEERELGLGSEQGLGEERERELRLGEKRERAGARREEGELGPEDCVLGWNEHRSDLFALAPEEKSLLWS